MSEYRAAFPDLCFRPVGDMIAEGDRVVVRWEGGGTHTGIAMSDFATKVLRERSGRKMWISGTTLLAVKNQSAGRGQRLAGWTDVDIGFLIIVEVSARERPIVAGGLVEHRNVRLDRALVDQPPQHLG